MLHTLAEGIPVEGRMGQVVGHIHSQLGSLWKPKVPTWQAVVAMINGALIPPILLGKTCK
jgi:hypothetical protein